jgi:hypothetical protein
VRADSDVTDIDNLVRTKASIYAACSVLLKSVGLHFGDLEKIIIAGGFGRYIDVENVAWDVAVATCRRAASKNGCVLFFPEGHRSRDRRFDSSRNIPGGPDR